MDRIFDMLDETHDGVITWEKINRLDLPEEEKRKFWENLTAHDDNNDGLITREEFEEYEMDVYAEQASFMFSEEFLMALVGLMVHILNVLALHSPYWHKFHHLFHVMEKYYWLLHSWLIITVCYKAFLLKQELVNQIQDVKNAVIHSQTDQSKKNE